MNKKSKRILIIILVIIIVSASFMAAKFGIVSANSPEESPGLYKADQEQNQNPVAETGSITSALVKLLGALIVVVVGIYGFLLMLRKMMGRKFSGNRNNNLLEGIETTYVAQKKTVSLVRFADDTALAARSAWCSTWAGWPVSNRLTSYCEPLLAWITIPGWSLLARS